MKQFEKQLATFLLNSNNWNSLKILIENVNSGKLFEVFCKYYFLFEPIVKDDYINVWYFDEIPAEVKQRLGFINIDYGVDLLLKNIDNEFIAVQCKFRSDETSKLNWSADKIANLFAYADKADGYIVFTNTVDIDNVSRSKENFSLFSISHLLNIEESTFEIMKSYLQGASIPQITKYKPQEHQQKAIDNCIEFFSIESRGQLIMPCGSGKTLTALWIKEHLKPKNTLVLVPSLALLRQIKEDWARQKNTQYHYLCVCSETDIDKNEANEIDSFVTHTYEIGGRVTTDVKVILDFIQTDFEKVIFSTYQSLPQIERALQGSNIYFDFVLCDEAHKTAGVNQGLFSIIHDDKKIPAHKRLYMTATPRIISENIKKKLNENLQYAYDMSNPEIFGYEFYRMTFKEAIEKGILVDYKIITVGITDEQIADYVKERRYISDKNTIEDIANNYALETVMQRYNATHAITFHSRVQYAADFSKRHKELFKNVTTMHVSGTQSTNYRNIVMNEFKNSVKAVMSNARCLTEGVDVPAIDLVYFCDPKNSKVDIVQATGRALRQDRKKGKTMGYIVIPIYHTKKNEVENAISNSNFKNLITVIRALCDQDERLQDEINQLAYGKGKKSGFSKLEFISGEIFTEGKIHLLGFEEKLKNNLFDQVIEKTSDSWDLWFLQLKDYLTENNNEYPLLEENATLYRWIAAQRGFKKKKLLFFEQIKQLNSINFIWDLQEHIWNMQFEALEKYAQENDFEPSIKEEIGKWYNTQKNLLNKGILLEERKLKIQALQFKGSSKQGEWQRRFAELVKFRADNPEKWPNYDRKTQDKSENELPIFCQQMRKYYRENTLSEYWVDKLLSINFNFEGKVDNWREIYKKLEMYVEKYQNLPDHRNNLYNWILLQIDRYKDNTLTIEQKQLLDKINIIEWYENRQYQKSWENWYENVKTFYELTNKLPTFHADKQLGSWLNTQRTVYKKGELSQEQIEKLERLGMVWNTKKLDIDRWNEVFEEVKVFYELNNRFPSYYGIEKEKSLYTWCQTQRMKQAGSNEKYKPLPTWQVEKLESIGFDFQPRGEKSFDELWEEKYEELKQFCRQNPLFTLPSLEKGEPNLLY
ncbi:MAG: hypothetical protein EAZ08_05445, partial [Cytophagales bacterium]